MTREHILPYWLRQAVGGDGSARHYRLVGASTPPPIGSELEYDHSWSAREADTVVRAVCADCNNGWMNDLDRDVEPIVVPLIRNRPQEVDDDARILLSAWATKIGLLLECTRETSDLTRRRHLVPPAGYREFYELRVPPAHMRLWMLRVSPPVAGAWWRTGPIPVAWFDPDAARALGAPNGSLTTFVAGMLGFQLMYAPMTEPYAALAERRSGLGEQFMRRLWPPTHPLGWPPPAALERHTLETVAHLRFA